MTEEVAALQYRLEASTARFERQIKRAESVMKRSAGQMERGARQSSQAFDSTARAAGRMVAAIVSIEGVRRAISQIARSGEQLRTLEARFDALTGSAERAGGLLSGVLSVSGSTGGGIDAVGQLVSQFRIAADGIGASDAEVVRFTESLIKLGTIGGATITEISNGTRQLSQGLAGGVLRAEEFNSVVENTPLIAKALADELAGGSLGALRAMVLEGRVLSDQVFSAILNQSADIDANFQKIPVTMERATNRLATSMTTFLAGLDEALGLSRGIANAFERAADFLDRLPGMLGQGSALAGISDADIMAAGGVQAAIDARAAGASTAPVVAPVVAAPAAATPARGGGSRAAPPSPFGDATLGVDERIRQLEIEAETFGMTAGAAAEYRLAQELAAAALREFGEVSEATRGLIGIYAADLGEAVQRVEDMAEAQRATEEAARRAADAQKEMADALAQIGQAAISSEKPLKSVLGLVAGLAIRGAFGQGPLSGLLGGGGGGLLSLIPGFASGTRSAPGGLAVVGERGPELVNLPRGAQVFSNSQSRGMMGGGQVEVLVSLDDSMLNARIVRTSEGVSARAVGRLVAARSESKAVLA